jgi:hypothetical protein
MGRYDKLKHFLLGAKGTDVDMTFAHIEGVLGRSLPPSAYKHRAWWSNNPDNNVMTKAWLEAGYQTADVDMTARTVTFDCVGLHPGVQTGSAIGNSAVGEMPASGFGYEGSFIAAAKSLSPRAQEWLDMMGKNEDEKEKLVIGVIEGLAAKALRRSILDKYKKLNIGSGSDSVDLIREDRDGR